MARPRKKKVTQLPKCRPSRGMSESKSALEKLQKALKGRPFLNIDGTHGPLPEDKKK